MTELSVAVLGVSPLPFPASAVGGKVSQLTGGVSQYVLEAAEVHSVRNVAGLLSQYICALIGLYWAFANQHIATSSPSVV